MTVPPFPSQDLAKLVLGYLAEEQLMTAYDEFLQASPYLDALRNEYDRIFMTSLKSILAEYRAVKIYVETCKPLALRKKVFQCPNLLDVVKFLITNVDINKIQLQEATEKASLVKQNNAITSKPNTCEVCHSLKLVSCVCKLKQADAQESGSLSVSNVEESSLQNSVETTPLADLPGNHVTTKKKYMKVLEKDNTLLNPNINCGQTSDSSASQSFITNINVEENLPKCSNNSPLSTSDNLSLILNTTVKPTDPLKSKRNIEEFDDVLKSVVNRNKTACASESLPNQRMSNASSFQDFVSGVSSGESQSATYNVPDSSTSDNSNAKAPLSKDVFNDNIKGPPKCQLLLQVSHINDNIEIQTCRGEVSKFSKAAKPPKLTKIQAKTTDKKIKIISDVKVDSKYSDKDKGTSNKPLILKNATSTPMMQMQRIVINGTPAYKHTPKSHTYTKDEIMAMPTLIVVPASGSSQIPTSASCQSITTQNCNVVSKTNSTPRVLGPLVIDVAPKTSISEAPVVTDLPNLSEQKSLNTGLVKTVDIKNATVPKDNVVSVESNTPQVLPPTRKSSSTPRRTSHVRILDFTTPRRILHENINEQVTSQSSDPPVEIIVSGSPDLVNTQIAATENVVRQSDNVVVVNEEEKNDSGSTKENDVVSKVIPKKYDWDADLRALIGSNDKKDSSKSRTKIKNSKKKKSTDTITDKTETQNKSQCKKTPKVRKSKKKQKIEDDDEPSEALAKSNDVPIKPNINIICGNNREKDSQENKNDTDISKNKSHEKDDDCIETPEAERLSLQNVIGAKLNISDLLETPYKQALYDIQMETPRFLGPDIPDEPLSDIKIMNIPTPRFLNTKPAQATPSSYSSRPTDYSSGGSYYKPDDQDYIDIPDFTCPVTSSKEDVSVGKPTERDSDEKKSRPVRQCTKNVSYYRNSGIANKAKDVEENIDASSSCSETISINSSLEYKNKKETSKTPRRNKSQVLSQTESTKKSSNFKKRKSPNESTVKDKTKTFMKIKPRYTPKKETPGRTKKRAVESLHTRGCPKLQQRKRATSKDKHVYATPLVTAVPTKSRRKSSTPRKLHCTKTFNSESSGHDSPEIMANVKSNVNQEKSIINNCQDSDTEQIALRWSDEGSQHGKVKETPTNTSANEIEDISKIKEFIDASDVNKHGRLCERSIQENFTNNLTPIESDGKLQRDLMRRGFDLETAKIIERDLLDDTPLRTELITSRPLPISVEIVETKKEECSFEKTVETDSSTNELHIVQDEPDDDQIELSVHECTEESKSYIVFEHDETKDLSRGPPITLKDNFTMEICIDDDVTVRLKATPFSLMLDQDPLRVDEIDYSYKETEAAVNSISNMNRLYTPLKESIKAQCFEIFDSTLTSLDTPLKVKSPVRKACATTVTDLVLEEKQTEAKDTEARKRKRVQCSSDDSASGTKRAKQDADILFKTANIQNIDIESVLTKLHGP